MRTATGEREPGIDLSKLTELEERMKRLRIESSANSPDIVIEGNAYKGYAVNTPGCGELGSAGGPPPPPNPGACCLPDGTCESVTPGQCLLDGGTFSGGSCDDVVCTGACCADDGTCTDTTEDDCVGRFQGIGTSCADDPPPCPTGACCDDEGGCTITTEEGCTGTYQGDDTVCDPNPCEAMPPCCENSFLNPDDGLYYNQKTIRVFGTSLYTWDSAGMATCNAHSDASSTLTINPDTCEMTVECSGTTDVAVGSGFSNTQNWVTLDSGHCHWDGSRGQITTGWLGACGGCDVSPDCPGVGVMEDFTTPCHGTCNEPGPPPANEGDRDFELTISYSNPCTPLGAAFSPPP